MRKRGDEQNKFHNKLLILFYQIKGSLNLVSMNLFTKWIYGNNQTNVTIQAHT